MFLITNIIKAPTITDSEILRQGLQKGINIDHSLFKMI